MTYREDLDRILDLQDQTVSETAEGFTRVIHSKDLELAAYEAELRDTEAEVQRWKELYEALVIPPVEPPPTSPFTIPAGFKSIYEQDMTIKPEVDPWTYYTGTQGNNGATFRDSPTEVIKYGPNGQELIAHQDSPTGTLWSGASRLGGTQLAYGQHFYAGFLFKLTGWGPWSWPSIWARPHVSFQGTIARGEGEWDFLEAFGEHLLNSYPRLWCSTIIATPYGSNQINMHGPDWKVPSSEYESWHKLEITKTKGQMVTQLNGTKVSTILRPTSGAGATEWDRQCEDMSKKLYLRLDHQAGEGANSKGEAGKPILVNGKCSARQALKHVVFAEKIAA